jgi:hypothetical protein
VPGEPQSVTTPDEIRRGLRPVRWLRSAAMLCLFTPFGLTAAIVVIHKLGGERMSFLVSGAPWTHRFWNGLFYLMIAGVLLTLLNRARRCPRCGQGFFVRAGWRPKGPQPHPRRKGWTAGFNVNVFGRQCLNCGLRLDGSNAG